MGKKILYVTNYYLEDVIQQRASGPYISQAGQNKGQYIIDMLETGGNQVTVWSNAWTSSKSFRYYKGFQSKLNPNVHYSSILGFPLLNALSCYRSSKRFLKSWLKNNKIDVLVFYNMRLETSLLALHAQKKYGLPIVLQYEDGLTTDAHISGMKRWIYRRMEEKVLNQLNGAFLVNSKIEVPCPNVVIRGAMKPLQEVTEKTFGENAKVTFLFSSTLDRQRGVDVLLEALKCTQTDFCLKITGRGSDEEIVKKCDDSRVEFLGYLDYEAYKQELDNADVCINAQLAHHEFGNFSFPSKIFEYLSARKLVVSSDVADTEETLGNALLIYHNDNPEELAKKMEDAIEICKDETLYHSYQNEIRKVIEENDIHNVAKKVNNLLDKM